MMKASRDDRHQAVVLEKYQNKRESTSCLVNLKKGWITKKKAVVCFFGDDVWRSAEWRSLLFVVH